MNLVIGDNNTGKSKLYDAFLWTLNDAVFDSNSTQFRKTAEVKGNLVSDREKARCEPGETVRTEVEMTVADSEKREAYILTRSYEIRKTVDGTAWQEPAGSQFSIVFKDANQNSRPLNLVDHDRTLAKILPPDVKPYMWFQGEQVNSLIDFNKNDTLTRAINVLSDISEFDFFRKTARLALEAAEQELRRERNRTSTDKKKNEELETGRAELLGKLERFEKELKEATDNWVFANEKRLEQLARLEDADKISKLDHRRTTANDGLRKANDELKTTTAGLQKGLFYKNWLAKDAGFLTDLFAEKFQAYQSKRMELEKSAELQKQVLAKISREFLLPPGVPEPPYIEGMLKDEHCKVFATVPRPKVQRLLKKSRSCSIGRTSRSHRRKVKNGYSNRILRRISKCFSKMGFR